MRGSSRATLIAVVALLMAFGPARGDTELAGKARGVLEKFCHGCHGKDGTSNGGLTFMLDRDKLVARNKIVPGKSGESELFQRVRDGEMPPSGKPKPGKDEIKLLQEWIDAGAPGTGQSGPRVFVADAAVLKAIRADLEGLSARERRFARYFTITHLANSGASEDVLEAHRKAITKLVNCLSWHVKSAKPQVVDAGRTIIRIDLRNYKWNTRLWDKLVGLYPYRVNHASADAKEIAALAKTELPFLRGDWFVATAARPPLYYELLDMPTTIGGLERNLQVDAAADIDQGSVARAGFNGSGVSKNNRLLERHDGGYGAYWRTYDFSENVDKQNLFEHPLGPPPARNSFVHAGGEAIFHLPNGLLGFLLTDGNGRRVDRASTDIVSDPQRPDRAVEAGLSCMSCHAKGYIFKGDQVLPHVKKNAASFTKEDIETIEVLYASERKFKKLIDHDTERYHKALATLDIKPDDPEPINAVTQRYESVIDLGSGAAEAGLPSAEFSERLKTSTTLSRTLGALQAKGGTVQRSTFQTAFLDLAKELRLGEIADAHATPSVGLASPFKGHTGPILCLALSADGKKVLSGGQDRTIRIWDAGSGKELAKLEGHSEAVAGVAFSRDGKNVLSGSHDRTLRFWDAETGKEIMKLEGHTDQITSVAISPDAKKAISGSRDKTVRLWDLPGRKELHTFTGHEGRVNCVTIAPDGKTAASGSHDRTVRLWDLDKLQQAHKIEGHKGEVLCVAFWPKEGMPLLVSGGNDHTVRMWRFSANVTELWNAPGHVNAVVAVGIPESGSTVLSGSSQHKTADKFLRSWNASNGKQLQALGGTDDDRVGCAAFSPDGKTAITSGLDGVVRVWKMEK